MARTRKRPEAVQLDLFVAAFADIPTKDARDTMPVPFFALGKGKRTTPIEYQGKDFWLRVTAPQEYGIATIFDADVLLWATSQINEAIERGEPHSPRMKIRAYDVLKTTGRGTGKRGYELLRAALRRLTATTVETSLHTDEKTRVAVFHWLERYEELIGADGRSLGIEIELPQWLYRLVEQQQVLTISPDYFRIRSGLGRWLYRVMRKHAGNQRNGWALTFEQLYSKSGSTQRFTDFARDLRRVIDANELPEYALERYKGERGDECVHAVRRNYLPLGDPDFAAGPWEGVRRTLPAVN